MPRRRRNALEPERGVTDVSLRNAKFLAETRGHPVSVELRRGSSTGSFLDEYRVIARYADGSSHEFGGFSWGYGGQGPNGLADFLRDSGVPMAREEVFALDGDVRGLVWIWPTRE